MAANAVRWERSGPPAITLCHLELCGAAGAAAYSRPRIAAAVIQLSPTVQAGGQPRPVQALGWLATTSKTTGTCTSPDTVGQPGTAAPARHHSHMQGEL
jgi:hypothetical protein